MAAKARTEAAATSAAASAAAVNDDTFMLITTLQSVPPSFQDPSSSGESAGSRALANQHAGVEARKPVHDGVARDRRGSKLAMLLCSLARRKYPCRHGPGADEFAHGPMDPPDIEQVILLAFSKQDILLDLVQDAVEGVLRNRSQEVERRLGAGDMHPLDNAPFEYGTRQALPRHQGLGSLAVAGLEQRDQLLRLPRPHLLQRHIET